jgi:hypothetical protein
VGCGFDALVAVLLTGGFDIGPGGAGQKYENFQELFSAQIILAELLLMLKTLQPSGRFVCKLFDCFSAFTASVIFITCLVFEKVQIVKPSSSRAVNAERYLVGLSLKDPSASATQGQLHAQLLLLLTEAHEQFSFRPQPRAAPAAALQQRGEQRQGVDAEFIGGETHMDLVPTIPRSLIPSSTMALDPRFAGAMLAMCSRMCGRQRDALCQVMDGVEQALVLLVNDQGETAGAVEGDAPATPTALAPPPPPSTTTTPDVTGPSVIPLAAGVQLV